MTENVGKDMIRITPMERSGRSAWEPLQWMVDRCRKLHSPHGVRVASHLAVWIVVLVPTIIELTSGWRPLGDNANIALRAHLVFSTHTPAVGQLSWTSMGQPHWMYDPGPLEYWLLSVPVRIDPSQGILWGAALCYGLVLSLAIEAVWQTGRWVGCALIACAALDVAWLAPDVFANLPWNAYFGLIFFFATMVFAWVVATGALAWWPVVVFTASVAAQANIFFAALAVGLATVSVLVGVARAWKPQRFRWLVGGFAIGAICWAPPLIQGVFGRSGNLSTIFADMGRQPASGATFGLRALAMAGSPKPIWTTSAPMPDSYNMLTQNHSSWVLGVFVPFLLVTICAAAWITNRRDLASLSAVVVLCCVGVVVTFAEAPPYYSGNLSYLVPCLWVIGIAVWATVIWAAWEFVAAFVKDTRWTPQQRSSVLIRRLSSALLFVGIVVLSVVSLSGLNQPARSQVDVKSITAMDHITRSIEHRVPVGPVLIDFPSYDYANPFSLAGLQLQLNEGIGVEWQLTADGWQPRPPKFVMDYTGVVYPRDPSWPTVMVTAAGNVQQPTPSVPPAVGRKTLP